MLGFECFYVILSSLSSPVKHPFHLLRSAQRDVDVAESIESRCSGDVVSGKDSCVAFLHAGMRKQKSQSVRVDRPCQLFALDDCKDL